MREGSADTKEGLGDGGGLDSQSTSNSTSCSVDNSRTVINKIANLYAERLMSDVCLVVGNVSTMICHPYSQGLSPLDPVYLMGCGLAIL